jgi:hypothetical protein
MSEFMTGLLMGAAIVLLTRAIDSRQGARPILRYPLRCWFLGHSFAPSNYHICSRCQTLGRVDVGRFYSTFWSE